MLRNRSKTRQNRYRRYEENNWPPYSLSSVRFNYLKSTAKLKTYESRFKINQIVATFYNMKPL